MAAMSGHTEMLDFLLSEGIPIDSLDALGTSALMLAARNGHTLTVDMLLRTGAQVNLASWANPDDRSMWYPHPAGRTALMMAQRTNIAVLRRLLEAGADFGATDEAGNTALVYAVRGGDAAAVSLLLEAGAPVNEGNREGATPLIEATFSPDVLRLLLDAGADVNTRSGTGETALSHAIDTPGIGHPQRVESVALLLSAGAEVHGQRGDNETPCTLAIGQDHYDIAEMLEKAGANRSERESSLLMHLKRAKISWSTDEGSPAFVLDREALPQCAKTRMSLLEARGYTYAAYYEEKDVPLYDHLDGCSLCRQWCWETIDCPHMRAAIREVLRCNIGEKTTRYSTLSIVQACHLRMCPACEKYFRDNHADDGFEHLISGLLHDVHAAPRATMSEDAFWASLAESARELRKAFPAPEPLPPDPRGAETPILDVDLTVRTYNRLKRGGVRALRDIAGRTDSELQEILRFNEKSYREVMDLLHLYGLSVHSGEFEH